MGVVSEVCPLCAKDWEYHDVMVEQIKPSAGSRGIGVRPIGWRCPKPPEPVMRDGRIQTPPPLTGGGGGTSYGSGHRESS